MTRATIIALVIAGPTALLVFMSARALSRHRLGEAVLWSTALALYAVAMLAGAAWLHLHARGWRT